MATAALRSQDCLRNHRHLDAFGSSPPLPVKHRRKKTLRPSPSSSPPSSFPVLPPKSSRRGSAPPARSPSPQVAKSGQYANAPLDPRRSTSLRTDGRVLDGEPRPRKPLVMQEVRILKRGEDPRLALFPTVDLRSEVDNSILCSTDRLGPEPQVLPKKVFLAAMPFPYAGPAYSAASPAPSSLPIPFFLKKAFADAADSDLASRIPKERVGVC